MKIYQSPLSSIRIFDREDDAELHIRANGWWTTCKLPDGRYAACPTIHSYMCLPGYLYIIMEQKSTTTMFDLMVGRP